MRPLRRFSTRSRPTSHKGGRLESYQAIYEMVDTLFYSPPDVSRHAPHVRDAIDLKRVMGLVVVGVLPCAFDGDVEHRLPGEPRAQQLASLPRMARGVMTRRDRPRPISIGPHLYGLIYFVPIY